MDVLWDWYWKIVSIEAFRWYVMIGWWCIQGGWIMWLVCVWKNVWPGWDRWHWKAQILAVILMVIGVGGIVWPIPELVEPRLPVFDPMSVRPEEPLQIRFDRPVSLDIVATIEPNVKGTWVWGRNQYGPLVDTLWFYPEKPLAGEFHVSVAKVSSVISVRDTVEYLFVFSTESQLKDIENVGDSQGQNVDVSSGLSDLMTEDLVEDEIAEQESMKIDWLLNVPQYYQSYKFTCFAASSRMVLGYRDVQVSELGFWNQIGRQDVARSYVTNIWGDPNKGIVGTYDGTGAGGYGAHWQPVADAMSKYVEVAVLRNSSIEEILRHVSAGDPVMVWWVNGVWPAKDVSWKTPEGDDVYTVNGMHVEVVVGWEGTQDNPSVILTNDPWRGRRRYTPTQFESLWKWFDNTAVVVGERR